MVRQQFAFSEETVPLNAANLCPSPRAVGERVAALTHDIDSDCSFNNREKFKGWLEDARQKVAAQLKVTADEVALVRNTSEANNTINNGLALKSGDEVVLWDQNHPTNNVAWDVRAARFGVVVKRVAVPENPRKIEDLIDPFEQAITPRTRVLTITHVSNLSGIRLPARELAEIARRRGIYFHLDGAQSWGVLRVDLREIGCDSYTASAHKWYCGPKEVGLLYVRKERIPEIWPNIVAPGWGDDADPDVVGARKFESLGQRDDAALAGLGTAAEFHDMLGPAAIEKYVAELATRLKTGLRDAGARLVTPLEPSLSGGVCILEVPEQNRKKMVDHLYEKHGLAGATTGGLRLCPHLYNTNEHIDRAITAVRSAKHWLS
jgi:selenocysteine lyase/cysteine desulfurase